MVQPYFPTGEVVARFWLCVRVDEILGCYFNIYVLWRTPTEYWKLIDIPHICPEHQRIFCNEIWFFRVIFELLYVQMLFIYLVKWKWKRTKLALWNYLCYKSYFYRRFSCDNIIAVASISCSSVYELKLRQKTFIKKAPKDHLLDILVVP